MQLPSEERIALVDMLLKSLNLPTQEDIDAQWSAEAELSRSMDKVITEYTALPDQPVSIQRDLSGSS